MTAAIRALSVDPMATTYLDEYPELPDGIYPTLNYCYIAKARQKDRTEGGIIFSDKTLDADAFLQQVGKIVAVGPLFYQREDLGLLSDDVKPKVGDIVTFPRMCGTRMERVVKIKNEHGVEVPRRDHFLEIRDYDIIGVIRDGDLVSQLKFYA